MKFLKNILFLFIIIAIVFPLFQQITNALPEGELKGNFAEVSRDTLSWTNWQEEKFQKSIENYTNNEISFRNILVRLHNQINFSLYGLISADGVVVGKNNVLYEYDYIRALNGDDYVGEETLDRKIRRLKYLQDYFRQEKNTDLLIVFEPGKATVVPEFINNNDLNPSPGKTNYEVLIAKSKKYGLDFLDLENFFQLIKDTVSYPLYPKYGTHWSNYGMWLALDTLVSYIESETGYTLPIVMLDSLEITTTYRHPDYDIGLALNLLYPLPPELMAYPKLKTLNIENADKQNTLVIADSYYWNIYNTGIPEKIFKDHKFWYFCKLIYPDFYYDEKYVDKSKLADEIMKRDVVIIMMTHRFFYKFTWGIIDELYALYAPTGLEELNIKNENKIKEVEDWFDKMIIKSDSLNKTLEQVLKSEADYLTFTSDIEAFLILNGINHYKNVIRGDFNWYQSIIDKALKESRTVDEQLELDAIYVFSNNYPDAYKKYNAINTLIVNYSNDTNIMNKVDSLAVKYNAVREEMLRVIAEKQVLDTVNIMIEEWQIDQ